MVKNGQEFDRYMNRNAAFDCTVVEFEGRGHEHFSDEILHLFDWMGRKQRNFFPKQIDVVSNRPSDNYFGGWNYATFSQVENAFQSRPTLTPRTAFP